MEFLFLNGISICVSFISSACNKGSRAYNKDSISAYHCLWIHYDGQLDI